MVFTHILSFVESEGVSESSGKSMVTVIGGAALAGRIGLSGLSQLSWVNTIILYTVAVFLCGKFMLIY